MINFENVSKSYGRGGSTIQAVNDASFVVPAGSVTGFLGPNGAGKTTCLRIAAGMTPATSGEVTLNGHRYRELANPAHLVGVMIDANCFHPGRSGKESLRLAASTIGVGRSRVDEVLAEAGLTAADGKRAVRGYSLGMRQRLGLAVALLGNPSILIIDEPTNGLDPQGQRWLGQLLRSRADRGGAVLLSSHQLSEVERIADQLVIIAQGSVVAQGAPEDLRAEHGDINEFYFDVTSGRDRATV